MSTRSLWNFKYEPKLIKDYVFHDNSHKKAIIQMIENKSIPHLLLSGPAGCGKSCLSKILIRELNVDSTDVLTINGSDENSVDVMRDKIKSFITTASMDQFKIVFIDEADYITLNGQAILRNMMIEYSESVRFLLTCNYENKIIPPLKSRCQQFRFHAHSRDDITELTAKILLKEKIKFDIDVLDMYISVGYPDIRKIINLLEQYTIKGQLDSPISVEVENKDYKFELLNLITTDNWQTARQLLCESVGPEEWEDIYRFLYKNINKSKKFTKQSLWEEAIVIIADYLDKNGRIADPEINMAACLIKLGNIK